MKIEEPRKILISGGWGYANLGDDAIVVSTVKLVKAKYPNAILTVMTFNPSETKPLFKGEKINVVTSINRILSGISFMRLRIAKSPQTFSPSDKKDSRSEKLARKLLFKASNFTSYYKFRLYEKFPFLCPATKYFKEADLFIQAGGGYFIQSWKDSLYSRVLELEIAHRLGVKSLVIGQSIGPFEVPELRAIAVRGLKCADVLSVRDTDSFDELRSYGLEPVLVPDTVLAQSDFSYKKKLALAIILGSQRLKKEEIDLFYQSLAEMPNHENIEIRILVSRLWEPDLSNVKFLYEKLKSNPNVKLTIPQSYTELQDQLGECQVLVSQNLHGLILAWRAGCACISINTKRKFVSFMSQSGQSHRLSSLKDLSKEKLLSFVEDAFNEDFSEMEERRHTVSAQVRSQFNECLDKVFTPEK